MPDLEQLQALLDRYMPFPNAMLTEFDAPDTSSAAEWPPLIHFERRILYHRENKGFRPVQAWVCDGMIVRATWDGDIRGVREIEGRTLDDVFGTSQVSLDVEEAPRRYSDGYKLNRRRSAA